MGHRGHFVWYELLTTDVAAASRFYGSVMRWGTRDASTPGLTYSLLTAEQVPVSGVMDLPPEGRKQGATPRWIGYVAVEDVDACVAQVKRLGGVVFVPPNDSNIGRISVLADPQAATLAVVSGLRYGETRLAQLSQSGRVGWHELLAVDAAESLVFYRELFGWEAAAARTGGPVESYRMFAVGGQPLGGMFNKLPSVPAPFWLYYFNVGDLDEAMARVRSGGGEVFQGPIELPDGGWMARCIDPQQAMFALQGPRREANIRRTPAPDTAALHWSTRWGGIASQGRLVAAPKPKSRASSKPAAGKGAAPPKPSGR